MLNSVREYSHYENYDKCNPMLSNRSVSQVLEDISLSRLTGRKQEPEVIFDEINYMQKEILRKS